MNSRRSKKGGPDPEPDQKEEVRADEAALEEAAHSGGSVGEKEPLTSGPGQVGEFRADEGAFAEAARCDGSVHKEEPTERYITNRDILVHIQLIIRLVDGFRVSLDWIDGLIFKMRQRSFDICERLNYPCSQAP